MRSMESYASTLTILVEEMNKEKEANNGSMFQMNQGIEEQLKQLCQGKGLI